MGAPTDDWESGFRALTKFVELKGHAGPAGRVHAFGIDLGGWVDVDGSHTGTAHSPPLKPTSSKTYPAGPGGNRDAKLASSTVRIIGRARRAPRHDLSSTLVIDGIDLVAWANASAQPTRMASSPTPRFSCSKPYPPGCGTTTPFVGKPGALHSRCTSESTMVPMSLAQRAQQLRRGQMGVPLPRRASRRHPAPDRIAELNKLPGWR